MPKLGTESAFGLHGRICALVSQAGCCSGRSRGHSKRGNAFLALYPNIAPDNTSRTGGPPSVDLGVRFPQSLRTQHFRPPISPSIGGRVGLPVRAARSPLKCGASRWAACGMSLFVREDGLGHVSTGEGRAGLGGCRSRASALQCDEQTEPGAVEPDCSSPPSPC